MPRLSWPVAWTAAGAAAVALLAANLAAPPVLAVSAPPANAVVPAENAAPRQGAGGAAGTDVTPPSTPPTVYACPPPLPTGSSQGVIGLCWSPSTDDVAVTGYEVYRLTAAGFVKAASTTSTSFVTTGLTVGRTYTFYLVAKDATGNTSRPTAPFSTPAVTGMSVSPTPVTGDTTPPSKPAGLRANCLPDFRGTSLCWSESTDDVGVAAYDIYRRTDTAWILAGTKPGGTWNFLEGNLVTGQTYTYVIVARDAAGNLSLPSDPVNVIASGGYPGTNSPPASPPPPATCKVEYSAWSFPGGFTASVKITNTGSSAVSGWTLRFAFPDAGQKVAQGYSATWSQSGKDVTAVNLLWNQVIEPGKTVLIGFTGKQTGANPDPAAFTLHNGTCVKS
ncbi:cellulose binding domain-containing protein [Microbispora tritici]|uniref:CBM2 domain-containing protein n=1 Tax=Microbispora tritici TaxID=2604471 RepID=A0ABY3LPF5_9ACTN|nr:cellulose binding domain-containing protein [Microbispora tritici]TYB45807.1 hypothetical protein FXF59_31585 [Microbispora tritici]